MVTGNTVVVLMVLMPVAMMTRRMILRRLDHLGEKGGSKLCEIGGNEQWEGQLIFLNSI